MFYVGDGDTGSRAWRRRHILSADDLKFKESTATTRVSLATGLSRFTSYSRWLQSKVRLVSFRMVPPC